MIVDRSIDRTDMSGPDSLVFSHGLCLLCPVERLHACTHVDKRKSNVDVTRPYMVLIVKTMWVSRVINYFVLNFVLFSLCSASFFHFYPRSHLIWGGKKTVETYNTIIMINTIYKCIRMRPMHNHILLPVNMLKYTYLRFLMYNFLLF